ncbi:MAG: GNAT family N-acetyltransferase [Bacillota bacterium]
MIKLKTINWDNFWDVIAIEPTENQKKYVQPVSVFLAESYINLKENFSDISLAIYDDKKLIGFCKVVFIPKKEVTYNLSKSSYMIDALIIAKEYQGKGYGKKALIKLIDYIKTLPFGKAETIALVCYDENQKAINLFKVFGFIKSKPKQKNKGMYIYLRNI